MLQIITSLLLPLIILGAGFYLYPLTDNMANSQLTMLEWSPLIIAAITLGLCLRFNRSRMFFCTLSVMASYMILQWYLPMADAVKADIAWATLSILLPVNFTVFSLLTERGILSWWGSTRFAVLTLPMLLVYVIAIIYPDALQQLLSTRLFEYDLLGGVYIYQGPTLVIAVVALVLNGRVFAQATAQNSSLFVAFISSIVMLHYWDDTAAKAVFSSTALLMMTIAVIHDSWSMAYIDQLTKLPGRRALDEEMLKLAGNYAIAMIDIDHFKHFNDKYGHDAGDQVLSMVASRIRHVGVGGKAFRYGGEEFTVVFAGKSAKETLEVLDELRASIAESTFKLRNKDRRSGEKKKKQAGKNVSVTISIGVANKTERSPTPHDVVISADKALYRAKNQGRNRVCK